MNQGGNQNDRNNNINPNQGEYLSELSSKTFTSYIIFDIVYLRPFKIRSIVDSLFHL